ncbi:hypothetical protein BIV57_15980 [Mangrovactinospora gilvigrisea]|uniref:CopG family transcriptional regulator n=1 Tax=Mangrovactinospora gilvigrisea TaxID=1428644 RepID=A0A1J7CA24_9ACTN|nr:hypothetical protein [Mangrovactinospora gilvigrisea]OIV36498.1 hypothetical protein BIV57_15980 [Mangrovactinospora gilvigrisea]
MSEAPDAARGVSVSLPENLISTVRERAGGKREFSRYVREAVEHRVHMEDLDQLIADHEARHGRIPEEEIRAAEAELFGEAHGDTAAA